jgi:initiation factor 1A
MPPKQRGGNRTKMYKSGNRKGFIQKGLVYANAENKEEYGTVEKAFGNCQFKVVTLKGDEKVATITGIIKKNCKIRSGDFVLIEPLGDNEDGKYLIKHRYLPSDKKILEKEGKLKTVEEVKEDSPIEDDDFYFEGEEDTKDNLDIDLDENFVDLI